jgi:TM2 domain-containing membrane protein YozV
MKNRIVAIVLVIFLGSFGVHKFYLGQNVLGVLYLIFVWTFIPSILAFFDLLGLAMTPQAAFDAKYNGLLVASPDVKILQVCSSKFEGATISQCVIETGIDPGQVQTIINGLQQKGLLTVGNRSSDGAVVYRAI